MIEGLNPWIEFHACFTGDCPHDNVNDCIRDLRVASNDWESELLSVIATQEKEIERLKNQIDPGIEGQRLRFAAKLKVAIDAFENIEKRIARPISMTDATMQLSEVENIAVETLSKIRNEK